jgi:hypothetical protein
MTTEIATRKGTLAWLGVAFVAGVLSSAALTILALDFYLSSNPYFVWGLCALLTVAGTWAWRNRDARKPSFTMSLVTAGGQIILFAAACALTLVALLAIYPPND